MTDTSATSVNMTKLLLHHHYGVTPRYVTMASDLEGMFAKADAALLIADAALQAALNKPNCYIYDLGQEWFNYTGSSMTYAVWAFPKRLISEREVELTMVYRLLLEAKERALSNMEDIVMTCQTMLGGSLEFWRDYFTQFKYGLDGTLISGLQKYLDLCFELKLLPSRPILKFWPEA